MSSLGNLWYTLGIKDETDAAIQRINTKLKDLGSDLYITPKLARSLDEVIPKGINIEITPNKVEQEKLDAAIQGKAMHAEVLPLADKLKTAVTDALRSLPVQFDNISLPPDKISAAVTQALAKADFTAMGDEAAKAVKVKVEGQTYHVTVNAKTDALKSAVEKALEAVEKKDRKLKLDKQGIKEFKDELTKQLTDKIKVTPTLNLTQQQIDAAVQGKVMRLEVMPLLTQLRKGIKDAFAANPAEIEIGPNSATLRNTINRVCQAQGYMINVTSVTGLEHQIRTIMGQKVYDVKLTVDPRILAQSLQTAMQNFQSKQFGLTVAQDVLRNSIDTALRVKPFEIQIKVMQNQARQAVQNALNGASNITPADALKYQRLMTGEAKAAQAELARLRASQLSARDAANAHTSASINLGGALGSNIKIAGELGSTMASLYSIHAMKQFLSQVIEIGGELEHQKIALETIYGTESKMETLYGQIKGLARQSPFGVMDLTKNVKQLSAYGVAYNEVYDTAKRLADISAATSVDIQRLILAFGKTKNRTFLDGLEAKQFAYANIPIYDALSKKLTELEGKFVSVKEVMGRIKKREIGFDMVKEILWDMTDEGGKFYNMQEKLAGSVKTSWKLVRDNIELMFGEIAESPIGEWLKGVGQTLQEVTRSWQALSSVIIAGGGAYAIYRMAVAGTNVLLERQVSGIVASHMAEKKRQAAALQSIGITSQLSATERQLIATRKRLTASDLEYLYVEKNLTTEEIKRLYLSRKISRAELEKAVALGVVTRKEFEQIAGTNALNGAWLRFKATSAGVFATLKAGAASAFGMIFNWTTAAMAAIGGLMYLWQHNKREDEIAESFTKTWKQKGEDMAKDLEKSLAKPFENLSEPQAVELINEYKNLIRDYSSLPEDAIQRAIYDDKGNIRNTADQIKYLREELESLKKTAESMSGDMGTIVGATGDGLFNEDVVTNLKDYQDAYNKANSVYLKFVNEHKDHVKAMITAAKKASPAFEKEIANAKNLTEQFTILMRSRNEFTEAWNAANDIDPWATRGGGIFGSFGFLLGNTTPFEAMQTEARKYKAAMDDLNAAIAGFKNTHENWDWGNLTDAQAEEVRQFYNQLIQTAEYSAPELERTVADTFEDSFKVPIIPDKTQEEWIKSAKEAAINSGDATIKVIADKIQFEGYDSLSDKQKELWEKLMKDADGKVQEKLPDLFNDTQSWINRHDLTWRINFLLNNLFGDTPQAAKDAVANAGGLESLSESTKSRVKEWQDADAKKMRDNAQKAAEESYNLMKAAEYYGKSSQTYIDAKKKYDEDQLALKELKWTDLDLKLRNSNKHGSNKGSQKDEVAESLKQRFKDIKDAWSEFQKWSKSEGREAAAARIGESGLFSTLPKEKIPQTVEQYRALVAELEDELRKAGIKDHSQRESLLNDLLKQLLDIDKTVFDEQLKLALDEVSKEAERQLADWNLFDKVRKATGDEKLAMSVAFGLDADAETDYPTLVKKQFNDIAKALGHDITFDNTTLAQAKALGDDIAKAYEDTAKELEKYAREQKDAIADILSEYQSLQDKLAKIDADRERKLKTVREADLSDAEKAKLTQRINVEADWQKFQQSNEYLRFFNDIYGLTMSEANKIGDLIQLNLNQKLQAGLITIYDYEKEMEKVRRQLEALRNVKSDAMTLLTGGFKGLSDKRLQEAEGALANNADYQKALADQTAAQNRLNKAKADGNEEEIKAAEEALRLATEGLKVYTAVRDAIVKDQEQWQKIADVTGIVANIAGGISDAFNTLRDMADSFGFDADSDTWDSIGAMVDTLSTVTDGVSKVVQSLMSGDIGGVIGGAFSTILSPITIWNQLHDRFLQKQIEQSRKLVDNIQRTYDAIERRMENFLGNGRNLRVEAALDDIEAWKRLDEFTKEGNVSSLTYGLRDFYGRRKDAYEEGGAYAYQRQLMAEQLAEMEKQKADMEDMKKKDPEAIADMENQIDEMTVRIREFAMEVAKDLYGIDLKDWASQLGDALFDAWQKGEDGAEAFKKKAGDILGEVSNQILKIGLLEPMMQDVSDYLFGTEAERAANGGKGGVFGTDFELTPDEIEGLAGKLMKGMEGVDAYNSALDQLEKVLNEKYGLSMKGDDKAKSGLSAGIQSITEDTADLLASYLNAIRADTSVIRMNWDELLKSVLPQMNVIAEAQLTAQRQIAENTLRNALAAEMIVKSTDNIDRLLSRVTQGGAKFHIQ